MPPKQRVRSHDGRELPQPSTAQPIRAHSKSTPIVIGQPQASTPQLAAKHTILFEQIPKDISLLAVQPPYEEREQQMERGGGDHDPESISRAASPASCIDPGMGHFGPELLSQV